MLEVYECAMKCGSLWHIYLALFLIPAFRFQLAIHLQTICHCKDNCRRNKDWISFDLVSVYMFLLCFNSFFFFFLKKTILLSLHFFCFLHHHSLFGDVRVERRNCSWSCILNTEHSVCSELFVVRISSQTRKVFEPFSNQWHSICQTSKIASIFQICHCS